MCNKVLYKWSILLLSNLDSTVKCTCVSSTQSHLTIRTQIEERTHLSMWKQQQDAAAVCSCQSGGPEQKH